MGADTEWILIGLEDKVAKRQGLPDRIPVPKTEFESLADKGLPADVARKWVKDFLDNSEPGKSGVWRKQNHALVLKLEGFLDKAPLWDKAQKGFAEGDYEKAMTALKRIIAMDADDHSARLNLASALANRREFDAALKHFVAIQKTYADDAEFHVAKGQVHLALKDSEKAIDHFVSALEHKPDHQSALDALVQVGVLAPIYENPRDAGTLTYVRSDSVAEYLAGVWDAEPRSADYYLEQLAYHERENRHAVALVVADRLLGLDDAAGAAKERASVARIGALRGLGRADDALAAAQALVAAADGAAARVELAKCLAAAGKADEGRAEVERALTLDPGDQQALNFRFWPADPNDFQKLGAALPELEAFAEAHAQAAGAWRSLARAYLALGREDDSLRLFAKAVELAPSDDDLRAEWWSELGRAARYDEILADVAKVGDLKGRDWKLRWNEAEAYAGLNRTLEARACFSALNFDGSLHVDIRKRAKRAVKRLDEGGGQSTALP
jgi:tetratricopeptide (TPR) repeat protein